MTELKRATLAHMHEQQGQARARFLRRPEVEKRTGLSRSAIYALMAKQGFPASIQLTGKAVGWLESSIDIWINERVARSQQGEVQA